jgi:hypothetical protein
MSISRNENVVLDPDAAYCPILIQHIEVDVRCMHGVDQIGLDDEAAEVNLLLLVLTFHRERRIKGGQRGESIRQVRQ